MTMDEILEELSQGNVYRPTVTVTIPEGYNIEQIARRLEENGLVAYGAFMEAVKRLFLKWAELLQAALIWKAIFSLTLMNLPWALRRRNYRAC